MKSRFPRDVGGLTRSSDLRVARTARPGWPTGTERVPAVGQRVYCKSGMAEVVHVLGKTSDGSRLLELRILNRAGAPFHAAASNVLVEPEESGALMGLSDGQGWLS